ncbi:hypothetical protein EBS80_02105 [bacterium]|nr:hypothetical protein [bacterium]
MTIGGTRETLESIVVEWPHARTRMALVIEAALAACLADRKIPSKEEAGWSAFLEYHPAFGLRWVDRQRGDVRRDDSARWPGHFEVGEMFDAFRRMFAVTLGKLWFDLDLRNAHVDGWRPRIPFEEDTADN